MILLMFIFGVVLPTVITVISFIGFLICYYRYLTQRQRQKADDEKLMTSKSPPCCDKMMRKSTTSLCRHYVVRPRELDPPNGPSAPYSAADTFSAPSKWGVTVDRASSRCPPPIVVRHDAARHSVYPDYVIAEPRPDVTNMQQHHVTNIQRHDDRNIQRHDVTDMQRHEVMNIQLHEATNVKRHEVTNLQRHEVMNRPRQAVTDIQGHDVINRRRQDGVENGGHEVEFKLRRNVILENDVMYLQQLDTGRNKCSSDVMTRPLCRRMDTSDSSSREAKPEICSDITCAQNYDAVAHRTRSAACSLNGYDVKATDTSHDVASKPRKDVVADQSTRDITRKCHRSIGDEKRQVEDYCSVQADYILAERRSDVTERFDASEQMTRDVKMDRRHDVEVEEKIIGDSDGAAGGVNCDGDNWITTAERFASCRVMLNDDMSRRVTTLRLTPVQGLGKTDSRQGNAIMLLHLKSESVNVGNCETNYRTGRCATIDNRKAATEMTIGNCGKTDHYFAAKDPIYATEQLTSGKLQLMGKSNEELDIENSVLTDVLTTPVGQDDSYLNYVDFDKKASRRHDMT